MKKQPIALEALSPERLAVFRALTSTPPLAWPTAALWLLVMGVTLATDVAGFMGALPLWQGAIINSLVGYLAFSVIHDAIHRSVAKHARLNDFMGQSAALIGAPYLNLALFRWGHLRHHRFTNGPMDPDSVLHGRWWTLPLRWVLIDFFYLRYALRHGDEASRAHLKTSVRWATYTALLFVGLVAAGYGRELFWLWFVPSRMVFLMLGFSFFWLPHVPHDTEQAENFTRATSVRLGQEWITGPALQGQDFHLIHHLFPMTPFYNNRAVWRLLEPELRQHELAIQHGFAIRPVIHAAGSGEALR